MQKKVILSVCSVLCLLAGLYFGAGYMLYDRLSRVALNPDENQLNTPSSFTVPYPEWRNFDTAPYIMPAYQSVQIPSRQPGITLSGWYIAADPAAPVILLTHGLGSGKFAADVLIPAGMLSRHGFNVLLYDMRNHGQSTRDNGRTSIGNKEYLDLLGAWDWLIKEKGFASGHIGLYGLSLGGAAALIAFGEEPRVAAVFVDASFADLSQIMQEELIRNRYPPFLWLPAVLVAKVFLGEDLLKHSPRIAILQDNGRPIFFVHGANDERVNVHHTKQMVDLARKTGANVSVWIPEGVKHVAAMFVLPKDYELRLVEFFKVSLH